MSLGDRSGLSAADIMALVTVINGDCYDNWNSANEVPLYFYTKE